MPLITSLILVAAQSGLAAKSGLGIKGKVNIVVSGNRLSQRQKQDLLNFLRSL
jgi:hypothetical protein